MDLFTIVIFLIGCLIVIGDGILTVINVKKYGPSAKLTPWMRNYFMKTPIRHAGAKLMLIIVLFFFAFLLNPILSAFWLPTAFSVTIGVLILIFFLGGLFVAILSNIYSIWGRDTSEDEK